MKDIIIIALLAVNIIITLFMLFNNKDTDSKIRIKEVLSSLSRIDSSIKDEFFKNRQEINNLTTQSRSEMNKNIDLLSENIQRQMKSTSDMQKNQLDTFSNNLTYLTKSNEDRLSEMRNTIEKKMSDIQNDNNKKLDEMRATVDNKLHESLDKKLGESFASISDRLEKLYKQMGEIGTLTDGVNDLKKALTNVKTRGIWGEIQLGNIIEDILTKDQYDENVITKPGSNERVEYAIKLPGKNDNRPVYLPVDAKFPQEDYQRLIKAQEDGDKNQVQESRKQLVIRIKSEAQDIKSKYIDPPNTTDFGIMFLPTESLYAEVIRSEGLMEMLQRDYKIVVTGPSTFSAFLNSLQMGFRTLAIEKRSDDVWRLLAAVKTEFGKFGDILDKTQKKLQEASNSIETASRKSRNIQTKLNKVETFESDDGKEQIDA